MTLNIREDPTPLFQKIIYLYMVKKTPNLKV